MRCFVFSLTVSVIMFVSCGKDNPTQPPAQQGSILLNRLIVSMVPGGSESVMICATKADGTSDTCNITNSDPSIASASLSDSTLQISGLSIGITNITVRSGGGKSFTLPVQVYSPLVLDVGELQITYTDSFASIFGGTGGSFWKPIAPEGFHVFGSFGKSGGSNPNGRNAVIAVKAMPGSDAIVFADSFELTFRLFSFGLFKTIAPAGYVAMGDVATMGPPGNDPPPLPNSVACIREDLAIPGEAETFFDDFYDFSLWYIDQPDVGVHPEAYLAQGTFLIKEGGDRPIFDPSMNVLAVNLPMLAEAPYQSFVPKLNAYDTPPEETVPVMAKAMLVPCSIINDAAYSDDIRWQVANSPFYRLERQVYYKLLYHNHNQTSEVQTNNVTITSGITTTESERIWNETSISLSVETGLSFKAISGKITATVSQTFGYETQTSVAELQQKSISSSINTPPGKAAALWQKYNRYILYRHNGTRLVPVSSWEFGIDSYVTDEYPD